MTALQNKLTLHTETQQLFDPDSYTGQLLSKKGAPALLRYWKSPHVYSIVTTGANWGILPSKIFGQKIALGHHAIIRLPGKRMVEWTTASSPTSWNDHFQMISQLELRSATGKQIEQMWQTHCRLIPKYQQWGSAETAPEGFRHYRPYTNDCVSYTNRILTESGQATHNLDRRHPTTYAWDSDQYHTLPEDGRILFKESTRRHMKIIRTLNAQKKDLKKEFNTPKTLPSFHVLKCGYLKYLCIIVYFLFDKYIFSCGFQNYAVGLIETLIKGIDAKIKLQQSALMAEQAAFQKQ